MKHWVGIALVTFGLSGCGGVSLNPFSWFGGQSEASVETLNDVTFVEFEDPRERITRVTSLRVNRTPGGAIVQATGLPPQQGWHSAALVPVNDGEPTDGVLTFDFRAFPPTAPTRASTVQSREIVVGYTLSNTQLLGVRTIRVVAATNIATTRR